MAAAKQATPGLALPFWFNMRQGKAEAAGDKLYKLTAPNLPEMFIGVHEAGTRQWSAFVSSSAAAGENTVSSARTYDNLPDAWGAAFELYRNQVVI